MPDHTSARLDFGKLLAAVEDAPPVAAADVLGEHLADALGAREVSFLIADFSGQALIRLGHAGSGAARRTQGARPRSGCPGRAARRAARSPRRRSWSNRRGRRPACSRR